MKNRNIRVGRDVVQRIYRFYYKTLQKPVRQIIILPDPLELFFTSCNGHYANTERAETLN